MDRTQAIGTVERYFALGIGILYLLLGIAGFIPGLVSLPGTNESYIPLGEAHGAYSAGFGFIFGLFATNFLHNLVRCAVGILGITSYTHLTSARIFNRGFAVSYILLAIMGLLPFTNTTFGLMPLFGHNVWLNALAAISTIYYGIIIPGKVTDTGVAQNL